MSVSVATACVLLFATSVTAPVHAWMLGHLNPFWLWGASFVHIDLQHLLTNLAGLVLILLVFGRVLRLSGWLTAFLVAAPLAHLVVVASGRFAWVAGLSTSLHALVGFAALVFLLDEHDPGVRQTGWLAGWRCSPLFGICVCAGMTLKVCLDSVWVTYWPEVEATTGASLHAMAAALGALGALALAGRARWNRPLYFKVS